MVDFWMTIGTMVADPRLVQAIDSASPDYDRTGVEFRFLDQAASMTNLFAGAYKEVPTVGVRNAINDFFLHNYGNITIPTSLYCAGKLCSLMAPKRTEDKFREAIANNQRHYAELTQTTKPDLSQGFLSALGLCLVDGVVRVKMANHGEGGVYRDLRFKPSEIESTLLRGMATNILTTTVSGFDPLDSGDWSQGCANVYDHYSRFDRSNY